MIADFGERCGKSIRANVDDAAWADTCRVLPASAIANMLTNPPSAGKASFASLRLKGARIVGDLNLSNARIATAVEIVGSRFEGSLDLSRVRTERMISLTGDRIGGDLVAVGLHAGSDLLLDGGASVSGNVDLSEADVARVINMRG